MCVCVFRAGRAGWRSTPGKMPTTISTKSSTASASCSESILLFVGGKDFCLFLTRHVFISVSLQRGRAAGPDGSRGKGKDGNVTSKMSFCPVDGDMSGLQVL